MSTDPLQHVVILVKENHTFDNYFGTFPGANGVILPRSPNPPPRDPDHRHAAWLTRHTTAVRAQFAEQDIPDYFAYARQFTLCDRYFTDVTGPSTPNHLMLVAADSPIVDNPPHYRRGGPGPVFPLPSLPAQLDEARLAWANYGGFVKFCENTFGLKSLNHRTAVADGMADCFDFALPRARPRARPAARVPAVALMTRSLTWPARNPPPPARSIPSAAIRYASCRCSSRTRYARRPTRRRRRPRLPSSRTGTARC